MVRSYESIREEERSSQLSVEGLGGWVEREMMDMGSTGVGIVEAEVEEDATKELAKVKVKEGGGTRRMDGRSR